MATRQKIVVEKPVTDVLAAVSAAVETWRANNTPENIESTVHHRLNQARDDIVLKLLGFDREYSDSYRLDHRNGRQQHSIVGQHIASVQAEAIKKWLEEVPMPTLTPKMKKDLQGEMRASYYYALRSAAQDAAARQAKADMDSLCNQLLDKENVDKFLTLLKMVEET